MKSQRNSDWDSHHNDGYLSRHSLSGQGLSDARPMRLMIGASIAAFLMFGSTILVQSFQHSESEAADVLPTPSEASPIEMTDVLVPIREIAPGRSLEPQMFMRVRRPQLGITEGTVRSFEDIKGQFARTTIPGGQPLHRDFLTTVRPANQVALSIPAGFRAVTINVSATSGVEGWARAGAFVDVAWVSDVLGERAITTLVKNLKVLSAERQVEGSIDTSRTDVPVPTTVTLLAHEKDAQKISLASSSGTMILLLRGAGAEEEGDAAEDGAITERDVLAAGRQKQTDNHSVQAYVKTEGGKGASDEWILLQSGKLLRKGEK